ncbi:hypothetical protein QYE76_059306 [Lolium multiflorum]|uniref:Uncharacterized protein n=1 Tax=Lolium multiflorum TaxID=4521 RepID=A0AAD8V5H6_LOLMU|nr:hypothetical protein QYE76_059306 [Lolium multiflorum]
MGGEDPKAKGPAQEETQDQGEAEVTSSEKVGAGAGDVVIFPKNFGDPTDLTSTPKAYATKKFKQLTEAEKWELEQDLLNAMLNNAWGSRTPYVGNPGLQEGCRRVLRQAHLQTKGTSSSLATTSSELENLRSSYQELEIKLKEAEQQKERAEKQLAEKNSEFIKEKGEHVLKRNADSETIKRQQKELNGLRKYMETAEHHWDLLAENILEPLGYPEKRRNKFPRDDVLSLAGDDCKDLISASRKICHNLSLKRSRTCGLRKLIKRMDILPELMDLDRVTSGVPPTADVGKLLDARTSPLKMNFKERDAEARPAERNPVYWTSSKDAPEEEEPRTSAATSDEDEESDEDVSSPAEGAKGKDPEGNASPSKAE